MMMGGILLADGNGTLDEVVAANEHLWPLALVILAVIGAFVWAARQRSKAIAKLGNASLLRRLLDEPLTPALLRAELQDPRPGQ